MYTDMRHFHAENTLVFDHIVIDVMKLGGGTDGKAYEGTWAYVITDLANGTITQGADLYTGTPKTHKQAARIAIDFYQSEWE